MTKFAKWIVYPWYIAIIIWVLACTIWLSSEYIAWWASKHIWAY